MNIRSFPIRPTAVIVTIAFFVLDLWWLSRKESIFWSVLTVASRNIPVWFFVWRLITEWRESRSDEFSWWVFIRTTLFTKEKVRFSIGIFLTYIFFYVLLNISNRIPSGYLKDLFQSVPWIFIGMIFSWGDRWFPNVFPGQRSQLR